MLVNRNNHVKMYSRESCLFKQESEHCFDSGNLHLGMLVQNEVKLRIVFFFLLLFIGNRFENYFLADAMKDCFGRKLQEVSNAITQ